MKEIYAINKLDLSNSSLTLSGCLSGELITIDLYSIKSMRSECNPSRVSVSTYITVINPINLTSTYKLFNPYDIDSTLLTVTPQYNEEEIEISAMSINEFDILDTIHMILGTPGVKLLPGCKIEILTNINLELIDGKFSQRKLNIIKTYIKDQLLSESEAL